MPPLGLVSPDAVFIVDAACKESDQERLATFSLGNQVTIISSAQSLLENTVLVNSISQNGNKQCVIMTSVLTINVVHLAYAIIERGLRTYIASTSLSLTDLRGQRLAQAGAILMSLGDLFSELTATLECKQGAAITV